MHPIQNMGEHVDGMPEAPHQQAELREEWRVQRTPRFLHNGWVYVALVGLEYGLDVQVRLHVPQQRDQLALGLFEVLPTPFNMTPAVVCEHLRNLAHLREARRPE